MSAARRGTRLSPLQAKPQLLSSVGGPPPSRVALLARLPTEEFGVLVIGGGATGCGAALAAQMRGLRTALIERGDFANEKSATLGCFIGPKHAMSQIVNFG